MSFNSDVVFLEICQHTNNLQDFSSGMFCVSSALSSGSYTGIPWQVGLKRGEALDVEGDRIVVREEGFYFVYSQVGKVSVISFLFHTGALLFHLQMFTFFSALVHLILKVPQNQDEVLLRSLCILSNPGLLHGQHLHYGPCGDPVEN